MNIGAAQTKTVPAAHNSDPINGISTGPPSDNPRIASTA
jgi:hypothetical protein